MKKVLFIVAVIFFASIFVPHSSSAQTGKSTLSFNPASPANVVSFFNDKKYFAGIRLNDISIKAMRHFVKTYVNAEDEKWYRLPDGFIASFTEDSVQKEAVYDRKGGWRSTLSSLNETQMPADIKDQVKSAYPDFDILVAYEIKTGPNLGYVVKIESKTKIKILQVIDGAMAETADYIKE